MSKDVPKNQERSVLDSPKDALTKIAVFDVDRTLIVRTSAEVQLIRFLRQRNMLPLANLVSNFFSFLRQMPHGFEQVIIRKSAYLRGLNAGDVMSFLPEFFEARLRPRISEKVREYMQNLREKEYEIVLISGTLDFILQMLVERLNAHGGIGSYAEIQNGKFTGRIKGIHPYFHGKVSALEKYLDGRRVDFACSYGFGDSWADVPLLSMFGHPVAVNPGRLLKRKARKYGWAVVSDY